MASESTQALFERVLGSPEGRAVRIGGTVLALVVLVVGSSLLDLNLLTVIVAGLQTGVVYSLVAVGLALIYKSTKVLNFAQGEIGTSAGFVVFLGLTVAAGQADGVPRIDQVLESSYPFTTVLGWTLLAIIIGAVLAIAINLGVVARLADAAPVTSLVATIGVALLLVGSQILYFEATPRAFPKFVEGSPPGFQVLGFCFAEQTGGVCDVEAGFAIGGANITSQFVVTTVVLALVAIGLAALFRTPVGIALLATSQEPYAAQLQGVSIRAMSTLAWGTAGAFGALAGVLAGTGNELIFPGYMTSTVLIPAIVAAVLGGLTSIPGAVVGSLILGLVQTYANAAVLAQGWGVPGPPQLATFSVLLLVLLLRPRGLFGKEA